MEHHVGQKVYSEVNDCWYRIAKGRPNSCKGCAFNFYNDDYYSNGDGEDECQRPYDLSNEESCSADCREDEVDIIYKEL